MESLLSISSAFGLSTSAGLNAYIPLLLVALTARFTDLIELQAPYNTIENEWVIGVLVVLLLLETLVDKIPAVDTANDLIQTFVRPAAGALLFAANANVINEFSPVLALIAGLILAGGVHATKGAVRPVVTASTAGTGNWFVSLVEDTIAFFASLLALFLPILAAVIVLALIGLVLTWFVRRRRRRYAV